jgi:pimeloyl-ACP methyl ester carboxylesterase
LHNPKTHRIIRTLTNLKGWYETGEGLMLKWFKYFGSLVLLAVAVLVYWGWASDIPHEELAEKYATGASDFITLPSGAQAHYRVQGNANGPRIILLHGSNSSLHTWEPWIKDLEDDYLVITADLPGHGLTGPVPSDDYSYTGMVSFVKELTQALEINNFILGGNSMGGGITLKYALTHPDDITGLILVDASGTRLPSDTTKKVDRPLAFRLAGRWYSDWLFKNFTPRSLASEGLNKSVSVKSVVTEEAIDRYWELVRHPGNRRATGLRFANYRKSGNTDLPVENITAPALIIWGAEDRLIPVETGRALNNRMPNSDLKIYYGVGHLPMEEIASETAAAVRDFLSRNN